MRNVTSSIHLLHLSNPFLNRQTCMTRPEPNPEGPNIPAPFRFLVVVPDQDAEAFAKASDELLDGLDSLLFG